MRNFIFGTDWWTDVDDVVALRLLCRAHKKGEINLSGVCINAAMEYSVKSLSAFMNSEGVFGVPIGIDADATRYGGNPPYQKNLSYLPSEYESNNDAADGVRLYRELLASCKGKTEIIEVGFHGVVAGLLMSHGDNISPLTGYQLVKQKVERFWVMAGKWDIDHGKEYNFANTPETAVASSVFCSLCPVPITFLGHEVGEPVISGGTLRDGDILRKALFDHNKSGTRSSWDPLTVLLALDGSPEKSDYTGVSGRASVDPETGENTFECFENGPHCYVKAIYEPDFYAEKLNNLIK